MDPNEYSRLVNTEKKAKSADDVLLSGVAFKRLLLFIWTLISYASQVYSWVAFQIFFWMQIVVQNILNESDMPMSMFVLGIASFILVHLLYLGIIIAILGSTCGIWFQCGDSYMFAGWRRKSVARLPCAFLVILLLNPRILLKWKKELDQSYKLNILFTIAESIPMFIISISNFRSHNNQEAISALMITSSALAIFLSFCHYLWKVGKNFEPEHDDREASPILQNNV